MPAEAAQRIPSTEAFQNAPADSHALGVSRSFAGRAWRMAPRDEAASRELSLSGMNAALAELLAARGVRRATVEAFLDPRLKTHLPEPHRFANMERAAQRFAHAIAARETVAVLGDYDVDGACA